MAALFALVFAVPAASTFLVLLSGLTATLIVILLRHRLARLILIFLGSDSRLYFFMRISVPGKPALVGRQRCWAGR
jgi:hypothetical protein